MLARLEPGSPAWTSSSQCRSGSSALARARTTRVPEIFFKSEKTFSQQRFNIFFFFFFYFSMQGSMVVIVHEKSVFFFLFSKYLKNSWIKIIEQNHGVLVYNKALINEYWKNLNFRDILIIILLKYLLVRYQILCTL